MGFCRIASSEYNNNNERNVNYNGNCNNNNKTNKGVAVPVLEMQNKLVLKNFFTYSDILKAYLDCRKRKRNKKEPLLFEHNFGYNLRVLLDEINTEHYEIGRSTVFTVAWPKPREIWAAQFRDRIVHHLLYNEIGSYFEKRLIEDTFSCIKGRGVLAASQRVQQFCRKITENWHKKAWVLQVDIANFFVSISRQILWDILVARFANPEALTAKLLHKVIFHNPIDNPIIKPNSDFKIVPRHKSLWYAKPGFGLPIGNLTSQFISNVYLDELDHLVKHQFKARYYVRYVDDAIFLSRDKDELLHWVGMFDDYLQSKRLLHLHPDKIKIYPANQGINFVGHIIKPFRVYPRRMTVASAREALQDYLACPINWGNFDSLQSYLGMFRHSNTYSLRKSFCEKASHAPDTWHTQDMQKILRSEKRILI